MTAGADSAFEYCLNRHRPRPRRMPSAPVRGLAILTCMDARLEPLAELGLELGDAVIIRNAGARVTDDALRSLALATHLLGVRAVAVMQHTGCALADVDEDKVARELAEAGPSPLAGRWLAMPDPETALRDDVVALASSPLLAPGTLVEGWRLDIETGVVERVVSH